MKARINDAANDLSVLSAGHYSAMAQANHLVQFATNSCDLWLRICSSFQTRFVQRPIKISATCWLQSSVIKTRLTVSVL